MNQVLVIGRLNKQVKNIIKYLGENNYSITVLTPEKPKVELHSSESVNIIIKDIENHTNLNKQFSANTKYIIYLIDQNSQPNLYSNLYNQEINNLIQFIKNNLISITNKLLFDFTDPNLEISDIWGAVNDVVMGGVSQSNIRLNNHRAIFSGIVSTDNNGGFASVRTRNLAIPWNLSQYTGIELKVIGDGKRYKFIARCEGRWDGFAYCASFDTVCNVATTIRIRFRDLLPVFRARTVAEAGDFDSSKVYAMQLMLSKFEYDGQLNPNFEPGVFGLEVEYIKAYSNNSQPTLIIVIPEQNGNDIESKNIELILEQNLPNKINYSIINSQNITEQLTNIFEIDNDKD